jgi:hypothetical protein
MLVIAGKISLTCHDKSILHQSEFPTDPVTFNAHHDLANNDANDLKVGDGRNPIGIAFCELGPAGGPDGGEEGGQVANREQAGGISTQLTSCGTRVRELRPVWFAQTMP